ncbi:MAG: polysaccharide biosynthesis C-terminal domain-containing protein [Mycoplasmataceae bacterium]|nr:polysaccharide biosynthesis C-terminal domain-containing protein [Mycoplasmataceae bacterium]
METTIEKVNSEQDINIKSQIMFETEKMWKLIIKMAVPTVLMFLAMALYTTIDTLLATTLIGQSGVYDSFNVSGSSDAALAIAGWTAPIVGVILGVVIVFNTGAEIRYSNKLSKRKYDDARKTLGSTTTTSFLFSVILGLFIVIFAKPIIESVAGAAANQGAKDEAAKYLQIQMIYVPFVAFFDLTVRAFRTEGKMGWATLVGVIGIPLNLLLDFVFMGPLQTGMEGAALASIIGYGTSTVLCVGLIYFFRGTGETNMLYNWKSLRIDKKVFITTLLIGFPFVFRTIVMNVNNIAFLGAINNLGTTSQVVGPDLSVDYWNTTAGAYSQTYLIVWMTVLGLVQGTSSVLAYNYGKAEYKRARNASIWTMIYMIIISLFFVGVFILITPQIMMLFNVSIIDSTNTQFIRFTLIRNLLLGISFVPFVYLLNTNQKRQTYIYSAIQGIVFAIVLHSFIRTSSSDPNFYKVLPWVISIADLTFLLMVFPYYIYKLRHIQRDKEIQDASLNSIEIRTNVKNRYAKSTRSYLNEYRVDAARMTIEWKVKHTLSNFASVLAYRGITVSSKKNLTASPLYRESVSEKWKEYTKNKRKNKIDMIEELEAMKFEVDKEYYEVLKKYKVRKILGILFCYDKENSPERILVKEYGVSLNEVKDETIDELANVVTNVKTFVTTNPKDYSPYIKGKIDVIKDNQLEKKQIKKDEVISSVSNLHTQRYKDIENMRNDRLSSSKRRYEIFESIHKYEVENYKSDASVEKSKKKLAKNEESYAKRTKKINKKYDRKKDFFEAYVARVDKKNKKIQAKNKEKQEKNKK